MSIGALRFLLLCALVSLSRAYCVADIELPTRLLDTMDSTPSVLVFAGHRNQQLLLPMAWENPENRTAVVILPLGHYLGDDIDDMSDPHEASSPVTMPRLFVSWRDSQALWRVNVVGVQEQFNLAPTSTWWLHYRLVVHTGVTLLAFSHATSCSALDALATLSIALNSPDMRATLRSTETGTSLASWDNLRLRVDLSRAQTYLPPAILARVLTSNESTIELVLYENRAIVFSRQDLLDDATVTTDLTQANATAIVIGRRHARRFLVAWAANASGIVAVTLAREHPSTDGVAYMLLGVSLVASYLLSFWTTMLAPRATLTESRNETRMFRHLLILMFVSVVAHAAGIAFATGGFVPLQHVGIFYFLPVSVFQGLLLIGASARLYAGPVSAKSDLWPILSSVQLLLITRTLIVAHLPTGTRSVFGALVFMAGSLVLVLLPTAYVFTQAMGKLAGTISTFKPWPIAFAAVMLFSLVLTTAGLFAAVVEPLLDALNARFLPSTVVLVAVVLVAFPYLLGAGLSTLEQRSSRPTLEEKIN